MKISGFFYQERPLSVLVCRIVTLNGLENWNIVTFCNSEGTEGDVLGYREIKEIKRPQLNNLAQTFPFKTFTPQYELSEIPDHWRYRALFQMYGLNYSTSMPELAGKRLTLSYVPATPYDEWLIEYYGGIFNVPAYLVHMKPQLDTFDIVKQNIVDAINMGWRAVVPQRNIQLNQWYGAGWIIMNPDTGSAGYLLAGYLVSENELITGGGSGTESYRIESLKQLGDFAEHHAKLDLFLGKIAIVSGTFGIGAAHAAAGSYIIGSSIIGTMVGIGLIGIGVGLCIGAIGVGYMLFRPKS
ncbi:MAG: hypothetical protein DRH17_06060 [Deltaproteobacteria bacterium]|nr:MAG: hypothetical protein DRH17_06060 [Deltaproteobacteria bacterium]